MNHRHGISGAYPVWIAALSLVLIWVFWRSTMGEEKPTRPVDAAAPAHDAAVPDATSDRAPAAHLEWRVEGGRLVSAAALEACLVEEGVGRVTVAGTATSGLTIHHDDDALFQQMDVEGKTITLRTPIYPDAKRTARRHVVATVCLYDDDAVVVDAVHGRRAGLTWPQLGTSGGLPVEAVVAFLRQGDTWRTEGLGAFGRRELGITFDAPRAEVAKLAIRRAAAAALAGEPGATRLQWSDGRARLVSSAAAAQAGWWMGPTAPTLWILAASMGPSRPLAMPPASASPAPTPTPPRQRKRTRPMRPVKKGFWPDYR